jgi:ABC-type multidrug transport system fused ATPase/permease subunit
LLASVDKLGHLFDLPIERTDGLLTFGEEGPASVKLHHVTYGYPGHKYVLDDVTFEIAPSDRIALTGDTGAGKSVLLDLIQGQRPLSLGHLLIDQIDPRDLRPDVVRRAVALVRDVEIFEGTISENVHLERPGITSHEIQDVLKNLGILDVILTLPDGLDTPLTPAGRPLSDNQCRLLMLARAIVGRPRLLLIDGLLDQLPDRLLADVVPRIIAPENPWTLILATGRQSLIDACDRELNLSAMAADKAEKLVR